MKAENDNKSAQRRTCNGARKQNSRRNRTSANKKSTIILRIGIKRADACIIEISRYLHIVRATEEARMHRAARCGSAQGYSLRKSAFLLSFWRNKKKEPRRLEAKDSSVAERLRCSYTTPSGRELD
jgi:hypothetical protein